MKALLSLVVCPALFCGCSELRTGFAKEEQKVEPQKPVASAPQATYPGWAYDAPGYMRPSTEVAPEPQTRPSDPLHFFTRERIISIKRPGNYTSEEAPRVAIYWTDNNGFRWNKAGYFGRDQQYFPFHVEEDGDYGVRFVGPGQEPATQAPAFPERVYHVDSSPPEVEVSLEPEQTWYTPGQSVTIAWNARDRHLIEKPVSVYMLLELRGEETSPVELARDLSNEGTFEYEIPSETLNHAIRFRVEALDRAANLGLGTSFALQIVNDSPSDDMGELDELVIRSDSGKDAELSNVTRSMTTLTEKDKTAPLYSTAVVKSGRDIPEKIVKEEVIETDPIIGAGVDEEDAIESEEEEEEVESMAVARDSMRSEKIARKSAQAPESSYKLPSLEELARHVLNNQLRDFPRPNQSLDTMPVHSVKLPPLTDENIGGDPVEEQVTEAPIKAEPIVRVVTPQITESKRELRLASAEPKLEPLVVPFPATLEQAELDSHKNVTHPWRLLGSILSSSSQYVWSLPPLNDERLHQIIEDAQPQAEAPVSHKADSHEVLVGEPGEIPEP